MDANEKLDAAATENKRAEAHHSSENPGPGGIIYNEQLRPLIDQIFKICDANKMPMVVMIEFDETEEGSNRAGTIHGNFSMRDAMAFNLLGID